MRQLSRAAAVALLAACIGMTAFGLVSLALPGSEAIPDRPSPAEILIFGTIFLSFPGVGLVVVWRRPENPVGWLFIAIGFVVTLSVFGGEYAGWAYYQGADLPLADVVAWVGTWAWGAAASIALPLALMLFPTGRLPSPRWRVPVSIGLASSALVIAGIWIRPGDLPDWGGLVANPFGFSGPVGQAATQLAAFESVTIVYGACLALAALITRFRRSSTERQQIKWLVLPAAIFVVAFAIAGVTEYSLAWSAVLLTLAAIPVCAGVAILRYRLYDIDVVIRRTLIYGALVAILGVVYVGLVLGAQAVLAGATGNETIPVAISTLAIAALFGPLRARVRALVDRRFYRSRYDARRTLEAFSGRLRDEVELEAVGSRLIDVAAQAVRPSSVHVWLRQPGTR